MILLQNRLAQCTRITRVSAHMIMSYTPSNSTRPLKSSRHWPTNAHHCKGQDVVAPSCSEPPSAPPLYQRLPCHQRHHRPPDATVFGASSDHQADPRGVQHRWGNGPQIASTSTPQAPTSSVKSAQNEHARIADFCKCGPRAKDRCACAKTTSEREQTSERASERECDSERESAHVATHTHAPQETCASKHTHTTHTHTTERLKTHVLLSAGAATRAETWVCDGKASVRFRV